MARGMFPWLTAEVINTTGSRDGEVTYTAKFGVRTAFKDTMKDETTLSHRGSLTTE